MTVKILSACFWIPYLYKIKELVIICFRTSFLLVRIGKFSKNSIRVIFREQALNFTMVYIPQVLPNTIPIPRFIISSYSVVIFIMNNYIPGGSYVISYIKKSHQDDPYRTILEILLIIYGIVYYLSKPQSKKSSQSSKDKFNNLSEAEINALIEDWEPESIVDDSPVVEEQLWRLAKIPVIKNSGITKYIDMSRNNDAEKFTNVLNLATHNFLQLSSHPIVINEVKETIKNYGVGACGPAGFYGNQDVHYTLEYNLASYFGTEGAVLYGQDFCVAASVIPAFTKRGDVIVADDQISIALQNALQLSRSTIYYFEHNNMESLDSLLREINESEKLERLPAIPRKFIVTEGLFANSGDLAPLPELTKLKMKYKFRLFLDETLSLGVLGATGRGLTEFFNLERAKSIDITVGSMATAFGSSGGFVLGDDIMSYHQHIGSNAYCFSASLPAYTTRAVSKILEIMDKDNSAVKNLNELSVFLNNSFISDNELAKFIDVMSNENSPILHFQLSRDFRSTKFVYTKEQLFDNLQMLQKKNKTTKFFDEYEEEERFLQSIVDKTLANHNVLVTRNTIVLKQETLPIVPGIKICLSADLTMDELSNAIVGVKQSILEACNSI